MPSDAPRLVRAAANGALALLSALRALAPPVAKPAEALAPSSALGVAGSPGGAGGGSRKRMREEAGDATGGLSAPASWPPQQTEYVVLLMTEEDATFTEALAVCRRACTSPAVQKECGQWDRTRHVTLLNKLVMTRDEAMRVHYRAPPACLPLRLSPTGPNHFPTTLALGFSQGAIGTADRAALTDLCGVPSRLRDKLQIPTANLHMSLYRTGRPSLPKQVKEEAVRVQIPQMRAACAGTSFGSVTGVKIVLKPIGTAYDESGWRVLAP